MFNTCPKIGVRLLSVIVWTNFDLSCSLKWTVDTSLGFFHEFISVSSNFCTKCQVNDTDNFASNADLENLFACVLVA